MTPIGSGVLGKLLYAYARMPIALSRMLNKRPDPILLSETCRASEKDSPWYTSFVLRPKKPIDEPYIDLSHTGEGCAILMQGPLRMDNDFTLETVKLYHRLYPKSLLVVSTWDDEPTDACDALQSVGAIVVRNEKPPVSGRLNVNYQLKSTKAGIERIHEEQSGYICKTRTDQRFYKPGFLALLQSLLAAFAPECGEQRKRIAVFGMEYGNLFYPFLMSDFFYFGRAEDIGKLFDLPYDERPYGCLAKGVTRRQMADEELAPEIYIMKRYAEKMGLPHAGTVRDYWDFARRCLICVDRDMLGLYWPKYDSRYFESARNGSYPMWESAEAFPAYNMDFGNWLNLYTGKMAYQERFETFADYVL